jgi:hypothetical protein
MTPKMRALYHLEVLREVASMRLSLAQKDFHWAKVRCDQPAMAIAIQEGEVAFRECGKWSNEIRRARSNPAA